MLTSLKLLTYHSNYITIIVETVETSNVLFTAVYNLDTSLNLMIEGGNLIITYIRLSNQIV